MSENVTQLVQLLSAEQSRCGIIDPSIKELEPNFYINQQEKLTYHAIEQMQSRGGVRRLPFVNLLPRVGGDERLLGAYKDVLHRSWSQQDRMLRKRAGVEWAELKDVVRVFVEPDNITDQPQRRIQHTAPHYQLPKYPKPNYDFGSGTRRFSVYGDCIDLSTIWRHLKRDPKQEKRVCLLRKLVGIYPEELQRELVRVQVKDSGITEGTYRLFVEYKGWKLQVGVDRKMIGAAKLTDFRTRNEDALQGVVSTADILRPSVLTTA